MKVYTLLFDRPDGLGVNVYSKEENLIQDVHDFIGELSHYNRCVDIAGKRIQNSGKHPFEDKVLFCSVLCEVNNEQETNEDSFFYLEDHEIE